MNIIQLTENKKQHIDLLLLADEQESMIDRYLERGDMFVLDDGGVKAVCVVTNDLRWCITQRYDLFKTRDLLLNINK